MAKLSDTRKSTGFRTDIQGLRFIAVVLVVLYHAGLPGATGGFIGVDIFFVISGFLITTHILEGLRAGTFGFVDFYARRVRRILPASLAVLIVSLGIAWVLLPPLQLARVSRDAAWTAVYIPNMLFAREGTNYLASPEPSLFQHYWSLGIEEQFYLIWPLILWGIYRISRRNMKAVFLAIVVIVFASMASSILLTKEHQPLAFFLLPTRAWELAVGGIVGWILLTRQHDFPAILKNIVGITSLGVLFYTAFSFDSSTLFPSYNAAIPVIATAAMILVGPFSGLPAAILQNRFAQWVGTISYSVYLVHWPLLVLPVAADSWAEPLPLWESLLLGALSIPLGWLSYRFVETPFRRSKKITPKRQWWPLTMTAVTGTVVASVAVLGMKSVPYIDLHVDQEASVFEASIHPDSAPFIGTNFSVRLQDAQSEMAVPSGKGCDLSSLSDREPPGCTYGTEGRGVSIALVGDSHAAQWAPAFEALAERGEIFLTAHTKSACSLHDRSITREVRELTVCKNWKKAVVQKLNEQKPEVIVLTHSVTSKLVSPEAYFSAMDELLDALPAQSEVVLLRDTPRFTGDPVSCLSRHLEHPLSCSKLRTEVLNETFYEVDLALSERPNVHVLDMTDYICADLCHVAQDNVLVYKDQQHLSKTFTRLLAPAVREELEKVFT